ncbi:hypothetical protein HDU87_005023 [Geranomyces variabilis]|uniref:Uncharacterized protein n=1 Tax=Geranomyces variabilis TaxID=109894 RepID=A0AAD5XQR5_9FUNG|nr:hypothetical protein HDU87_005023 [Geranomyces variabilis]
MTTTKSEEQSRQDKGIAELGTYMLKGWVLTDTLCPNQGCNIPVVRKRDRSAQMCVLCDDPDHPWLPVKRAAGEESVAAASADATTSAAPESGASNILTAEEEAEIDATLQDDLARQQTADFEQRREQGNRASKLLGQKMLQGWTLLDQLCKTPTCIGIPLVRNRRKQTLCVICEGDGAAVEPPAQVVAPPAAAAVPLPARATPTETDSPKRRKLAPASANTASSASSAAAVSKTPSQDLAAQVDATISTLVIKLEELRQLASHASLPANTREACDAIASCAGAIAALQAVRQ